MRERGLLVVVVLPLLLVLLLSVVVIVLLLLLVLVEWAILPPFPSATFQSCPSPNGPTYPSALVLRPKRQSTALRNFP